MTSVEEVARRDRRRRRPPLSPSKAEEHLAAALAESRLRGDDDFGERRTVDHNAEFGNLMREALEENTGAAAPPRREPHAPGAIGAPSPKRAPGVIGAPAPTRVPERRLVERDPTLDGLPARRRAEPYVI